MILVTGSNGFVGTALCERLSERGEKVRRVVRGKATGNQVSVGEINGQTKWLDILDGCRTVVHLAARVHVMSDSNADPLQAYRSVNVDGTVNLARQAHAAGVTRFVFISSIKVNGEVTHGQAFRSDDAPHPCDPYGQSKLEAELALTQWAAETKMEVVIIRPPLVYGPGVKANFHNLIKLVDRGLPLPFGAIHNRRSMVAVGNLVDLIITCCNHPDAPGHIFLVSDAADVSVRGLVSMMAAAMHKRVVLVPVPPALIMIMAKLVGKRGVAERLVQSLEVDISHTQAVLGWNPAIAQERAISETLEHFYRTAGRDKK